MTIDLVAQYAALAEEVYQRNNDDVPLDLRSIFGENTASLAPLSFAASSGLVSNPATGMVYSSRGDGFAAQVIQVNGGYVIAFRGTDMSSVNLIWDDGDLRTDAAIAGGAAITGQIADLRNLITQVKALADGANITVVGQSLGGGLATLAGSAYGFQTYAYDPAPFAAELGTLAYLQAADELGLSQEVAGQPMLTNDLLNWLRQTAGFQARADALLTEFEANVSNPNLIHSYRVANEVLSTTNNWLSWGLSLLSQPFSTVGASITTLNAGSGDALALHHPSLIALLLKEASLNNATLDKPSFSQLTLADGSLRNALWNENFIAGPNDNVRADPDKLPIPGGGEAQITSRVAGGGQQTAILYRALWIDDAFRANFEKAFSKIDHGAASSGQSAAHLAVMPSPDHYDIHRALVEFGLRVVRDGIHSPEGNLSINDAARYVFDPVHNGEDVASQDGNYAVIRTDDFQDQRSERLRSHPLQRSPNLSRQRLRKYSRPLPQSGNGLVVEPHVHRPDAAVESLGRSGRLRRRRHALPADC